MTATNVILKERFDLILHTFLFSLCLPESYLEEFKKFTAPMINGYRLNHISRNLNKDLDNIDLKYILKCCKELYHIYKLK